MHQQPCISIMNPIVVQRPVAYIVTIVLIKIISAHRTRYIMANTYIIITYIIIFIFSIYLPCSLVRNSSIKHSVTDIELSIINFARNITEPYYVGGFFSVS